MNNGEIELEGENEEEDEGEFIDSLEDDLLLAKMISMSLEKEENSNDSLPQKLDNKPINQKDTIENILNEMLFPQKNENKHPQEVKINIEKKQEEVIDNNEEIDTLQPIFINPEVRSFDSDISTSEPPNNIDTTNNETNYQTSLSNELFLLFQRLFQLNELKTKIKSNTSTQEERDNHQNIRFNRNTNGFTNLLNYFERWNYDTISPVNGNLTSFFALNEDYRNDEFILKNSFLFGFREKVLLSIQKFITNDSFPIIWWGQHCSICGQQHIIGPKYILLSQQQQQQKKKKEKEKENVILTLCLDCYLNRMILIDPKYYEKNYKFQKFHSYEPENQVWEYQMIQCFCKENNFFTLSNILNERILNLSKKILLLSNNKKKNEKTTNNTQKEENEREQDNIFDSTNEEKLFLDVD